VKMATPMKQGGGREAKTMSDDRVDPELPPAAPPPDPAESLRYVFVERPRCPACGSADLKTNKTTRDPDGSACRDTKCRDCGWHFFVVVE